MNDENVEVVQQIRTVVATEEELSTIRKIAVEGLAFSFGSAYLTYRIVGKITASSNVPIIKRWATVLKIGTAITTFGMTPKLYFGMFGMPRIKRLPASEFTELYTNKNKSREERREFISRLNKQLQTAALDTALLNRDNTVTQQPDFVTPSSTRFADNKQPQHLTPIHDEAYEYTGRSAHLTDKHNQYDRFDNTKDSHQTNTNEFDYSKSNTIHPTDDDIPEYSYTNEQPKIIRRNKYGDIISED